MTDRSPTSWWSAATSTASRCTSACSSSGAQPARLAWLAANLGRLTGSGIIYCLTVAATRDVAGYLQERGHLVTAYSGQTDQAERLAAEDDLVTNRVKALVATSALGMGFDKPDLGFVIHLGAPPSPIAYYQQVGRAGRGVDEAVVILLPGREDVDVWAYFASLSFPPERDVREAIQALESSRRADVDCRCSRPGSRYPGAASRPC